MKKTFKIAQNRNDCQKVETVSFSGAKSTYKPLILLDNFKPYTHDMRDDSYDILNRKSSE